MKRVIFSSLVMLLGAVAGCGSSTPKCETPSGVCGCPAAGCGNGQVCDTATNACVNPPSPPLGAVIDRMGRPGVNTALTNPFDLYEPQAGVPELSDGTKDRYNLDGNPSMWVPTWSPAIRLHLGILDALDDSCGNQAGYGALSMPNYTLLSAVLAGDALQVDTTKTICNVYLGAELAALGAPLMDCGGRKLNYDVIDVTYSALAVGMLGGVTDGPISEHTVAGPSFPFMASPK
jgi:hypothetical protein